MDVLTGQGQSGPSANCLQSPSQGQHWTFMFAEFHLSGFSDSLIGGAGCGLTLWFVDWVFRQKIIWSEEQSKVNSRDEHRKDQTATYVATGNIAVFEWTDPLIWDTGCWYPWKLTRGMWCCCWLIVWSLFQPTNELQRVCFHLCGWS